MKVFIFGATGFIGLPACQAFVRKGYTVYGQTRSAGKAKLLEENEIIPVVADPASVEQWLPIAEKADVVINCVGGSDIYALAQTIFDATCQGAQKTRSSFAPKLTYIYCSGTWVHGEDRTEVTSERSPPKNTTQLVAWRPQLEQKVLTSTDVDGIVLRPALVYGRSGSITAMLFGSAQPGQELVWAGRKGGRWAMIHVDDLADAFLRVAEAGPICKGLVLDIANDASESVDDVLEAAVRVSGASGYRYRDPNNLFEEAIATTTLLRPSLARTLVGWRPYKASMVDGIRQYYAAWKASA